MWEVSGTGGVVTGTPQAAREDSDWLQQRPGRPMGSQHPQRRTHVPGKTGKYELDKNITTALSVFHGSLSEVFLPVVVLQLSTLLPLFKEVHLFLIVLPGAYNTAKCSVCLLQYG